MIAERLACAPRHPVPCHRNPLALAYGFPVGKLVRAAGAGAALRARPRRHPLLPVDFRRCRQRELRDSRARSGPDRLAAQR